jgi:microcompartment protein CcmK/EutM
MQIARVIGDIVATRKDEALVGLKLLVVQTLDTARQPVGRPIVAADAAGAGVGEEVFFVKGREAVFPFYPAEPPVDAAIVGIVDHWSADGAPVPSRAS